MTQKLTSAAEAKKAAAHTAVRIAVVTMDTHLASATDRAMLTLRRELPGLQLSMHAASEYANNPAALARCKADIAAADIIVAGMLFLEEHFLPVMEDLVARRDNSDAMICMASASEVVKLTRRGNYDRAKPASGPNHLLPVVCAAAAAGCCSGASPSRTAARPGRRGDTARSCWG